MFDFLKKMTTPKQAQPAQVKKDPLLFTIDVMLDPCNDAVLNEGTQVMTLDKNGTAYAGRKIAGKIDPHCWAYITGFGTPDQMKRLAYNRFKVEVRGAADMSDVFPDPHDKPYIYRCGYSQEYPHMLPMTEYRCSLVDQDDHFDVVVAGNVVGRMNDDRYGRLKKLSAMISKGFQTTAQIDPDGKACGFFVIVRKV